MIMERQKQAQITMDDLWPQAMRIVRATPLRQQFARARDFFFSQGCGPDSEHTANLLLMAYRLEYLREAKDKKRGY